MSPLFRRDKSCPLSPVGVELGDHVIRLAQVREERDGPVLTAAASVGVDLSRRDDAAAYGRLVRGAIQDHWHRNGFRGDRVRVGLPSSRMRWQTLSLSPKLPLTEVAVREAAADIGADDALRYFESSRSASDRRVVCVSLAKPWLDAILAGVVASGRTIAALSPGALGAAEAFGRLYRRREDAAACDAVIDLGRRSTRILVLRHGRPLRAGQLPVGGDALDAAAAAELGVATSEAGLLRRRLSDAEHVAAGDVIREQATARGSLFKRDDRRIVGSDGRAGSGLQEADIAAPHCHVDGMTIDRDTGDRVWRATVATADQIARGVAEFCCRDATGLNRDSTPTRLLFIGGEANNRRLCRHVAEAAGLPAQVGETLCRLRGANTPASFADDRPRPEWTGVVGLALANSTAAQSACAA